MTYREKYQQLHPEEPEENVSDIHLRCCPDEMLDVPAFPYPFPNDDFSHGCRACWDTEIPSTEVVPPKSEPETQPAPTPEKTADGAPTARVLAEAVDDVIHMSADGDVHDLILCALGAVHIAAKEIYDSAKDKLAAEKLIHEMQNALRPTGKIWCFDDE